MTVLLEHLQQQKSHFPAGSTIVIGVSGGVDSLSLLHALNTLKHEWNINLHVATLNHGLRGDAGIADANFVEAMAHEWGLPCTRGMINVHELMENTGLNLEEAARQSRYTFFFQTAIEIGANRIVIAHNQNDQAETILMNIIRGTGLQGMQGCGFAHS